MRLANNKWIQEWSRQITYWLRLSANPISATGIVITSVSFILMLVLFVLEFLGYLANPYVGMITYLILPLFFVAGLAIIPIGVWRSHKARLRRLAKGQVLEEMAYPRWDFNNARVRRTALLIFITSVANVTILSTATYQGIHYMESVEFCGTVCHTVMKPEFTSYQGSAHARVACTTCHIGPGADWFVKSKLSGVRQVFAVALDSYARPIATPVHNLRPARETCEQCHWPEKFYEPKVRILKKFRDDEKNTPLTTVLLMRVGGVKGPGGNGHGIHWWHMEPYNKVSYRADAKRENISWVKHENLEGKTTEYRLPGDDPSNSDVAQWEERVMDCIDCHNRPTHIYHLPEKAVDLEIEKGTIDPQLPFIKKKGVELLKAAYDGEAAVRETIRQQLIHFYQQSYPEIHAAQLPKIESAAEGLYQAYSRNVFPGMKVTWGTYPDNIGHENFPGCFRCHDDSHASPSGKTIRQDCSSCHELLAMEEENPALIEALLASP